MGDVSLSLRSWNKSSDYCSWIGVKCDAKSGKVVSLSFIFIHLNNSFKPNSGLFKLQYLQNLTFYNCYLYGEIPSSLGNFSHLTLLELTQNNFVGPLPASIGNLTQLRYLRLSQNSFSGKIPNSFANLTKLSEVNLDNNYFESTLPPDMSRFHSLEYFSASANSFLGSFPRSFVHESFVEIR
ncbi:unnamed protein product [Arabis nemorensis]|uniref:Uncharacterized protein n=1 Tax=Arabis nemorensis TaxID=586526 RepID=A0A565B6S0_9BRAS|nr:unnamed protein product [Arabis nemorensis]